MATRTVAKDIITLHGSTTIVNEFFATRPNQKEWDSVIKLPTEPVDADSDEVGT
ncbi:hypothetical protein JHK82_050683 [Glycine max]|nr:hypothetical protein JHK86_050549 [Glycine max]KAG4936472.1 hypothetical protein JHK85_051391 [Glycine max]KAG5091905.1 hypothetical protein JHK82_050683 [Glycine max]